MLTTARHESVSAVAAVASGMARPPSPTITAMPFMRRPRSCGNVSDERALAAVFTPADTIPIAASETAAPDMVVDHPNSGRHTPARAE